VTRTSVIDDAVLVRRVDYGEADVIATLFTREHGKVSALARAARKSRKRFGGGLGLLTVSRVEMRSKRGSEMWTLLSAEPRRTFASLAADMAALTHASYGTELVRELTAAEQPEPAVFDLLVELYGALEARGAVPAMLRVFELRLLELVGLGPVLEGCASCGDTDVGRAVIHVDRGGVLCGRCASRATGVGVRPISEDARELLIEAQRTARIEDVAETTGAAANEARDVMMALLVHHIGKPLRSLQFASKLGAGRR
jgi:DNA repair protein RecO (recombination protein O)